MILQLLYLECRVRKQATFIFSRSAYGVLIPSTQVVLLKAPRPQHTGRCMLPYKLRTTVCARQINTTNLGNLLLDELVGFKTMIS